MSKIIDKYESLKKEDSQKVYLFKSGIFYIFLNDDAKLINNKLGLKIVDFGLSAIKCGFPSNNLEKYILKLKQNNIDFLIIDDSKKIENKTEYLNNLTCESILKEIKEINMDETSFKIAFEKLLEFQNKLRKLEGN